MDLAAGSAAASECRPSSPKRLCFNLQPVDAAAAPAHEPQRGQGGEPGQQLGNQYGAACAQLVAFKAAAAEQSPCPHSGYKPNGHQRRVAGQGLQQRLQRLGREVVVAKATVR